MRLPTVRLSWTGPLLLCALLTSGCQSDSDNPSQLLAGEPAGNSAALTSDNLAAVLSSDALTAPDQPELTIRSEAARLIFEWTPIAGQTVARLYQHDSALPGETLVFESVDTQQHLLHLPSATPQTPWHREQYRLELCTADDCLSSERMTLSGLAAATAQYLSPTVFLQGERYAEHLAVNRDASLAVVSMPLQGALEFYIRSDTQWSLSQRLRLDALPDAATRSLLLSASALGDTIAVFVKNTADANQNEIRILERLGETWLQTTALPLDAIELDASGGEPTDSQETENAIDQEHSLLIAADGNGLLLQSDERLYTSKRHETGWSSLRLLADVSSSTTISAPDTLSRLTSSTANRDLTRVMAVVQHDGSNQLKLWSSESGAENWQQTGQLSLTGFSQQHELAVHGNAQGDEILIAGWESGNSSERYPIMWHYSIQTNADMQSSATGIALQALDSLRAPPTTHTQATLAFNASETLTQVVLGWQSSEDTVTGLTPDAAVSTWQFHTQPGQWLSALELPEAIPTLAKQTFASGIVLSADGSTLMLPAATRPSQPSGPDIGEVLVLR